MFISLVLLKRLVVTAFLIPTEGWGIEWLGSVADDCFRRRLSHTGVMMRS
jgi:hypothetical protein